MYKITNQESFHKTKERDIFGSCFTIKEDKKKNKLMQIITAVNLVLMVAAVSYGRWNSSASGCGGCCRCSCSSGQRSSTGRPAASNSSRSGQNWLIHLSSRTSFPSVHLQMFAKVIRTGKPFGTNRTAVRLHSGVGTFVTCQFVRSRKTPSAPYKTKHLVTNFSQINNNKAINSPDQVQAKGFSPVCLRK